MGPYGVIFGLAVSAMSAGCGGTALFDQSKADHKNANQETQKSSGEQEEPTVEDNTVPANTSTRTKCQLPNGASAADLTIATAVDLINALPRPVSVACLIDVLPRPLAIQATSSTLSVQPAVGNDSPRIFLDTGSIYISFALAGEGAKTVEFSQPISDSVSIKGELPFPVKTKKLVVDDAYESILRSSGVGTTCSACHSSEAPAGGEHPASAYLSKAFKPFPAQRISLERLKVLERSCLPRDTFRCDVLEAIFDNEDQPPAEFDFPAAMATFF